MKRIIQRLLSGWTVSALILGSISLAARADDAAPLRWEFEKSFAHPGPAPYVATFTGSVSGDVEGCLVTRVTRRVQLDDGKVEIAAEYAVYDGDCGPDAEPLLIVELSGKSSHNHYVLTGKVIQGWLLGAQAHVEFDAVPCPEGKVRCFAGAIRIMTGSAD